MSGIDKLVKPVENEMNQCKNLFDSFMSHSSNLLLNDVLQRISSRKGKMMRPLLTILVAKLLGEINERTYSAALAFEFLHTASLVHDDIVDESCERRGNPSVNQLFGDKVAVLVGDYLLSHVLLNAAKTESTRLIEIVARVSERLADGELLQLRNIYNQTISEDVYFNIIQGKTAELFAAAAEGGALTVNASEEDLERLRLFGETVGICFQIKDDIFDYIAGEEIGKPTGNDMAEGKLTLPVIHALFSRNQEDMFQLAYKVKDGSISADEIATLVRFTLENQGIDYAEKIMRDYANKAKSMLSCYPESNVKSALLDYVDYVINRNY